jgi:hypothetical protein
VESVLSEHLDTGTSAFTIGSFGAIAEYFRDADEAATRGAEPLTRITARAAIRIRLVEDILPVAYETVSAHAGRWQHGVLFCLPRSRGAGQGRTVLTELGPDGDAIRPLDRGGILFDLGLDLANLDFCVRTADERLADLLRLHAGRSVLEAGNPVMGALIEASPHRVAQSALARIEVYQALDRTKTPDGPHTHVLPDLLKSRRTHAANIPVPDDVLPCLGLHPGNPLLDLFGRATPFDAAHHRAFEPLLAAWGDADYCAEKARILAAVAAGGDPAAVAPPASRTGRQALRIALRQLACAQPRPSALDRWLEVHERNA